MCSIFLKTRNSFFFPSTLVTHSLEGNTNLICPDGLCVNKAGNGGAKKTSVVIPVVASVAFVVVLGSALAFFFVFKKRKTSNSQGIYACSF